MDQFLFLIRYTPFWAIPFLLIGGEFSYMFWIRKKKKWVMITSVFAIFGFVCTAGYYIAGGPEKSVEKAIALVWYFTR